MYDLICLNDEAITIQSEGKSQGTCFKTIMVET